ncbi:hypothetical protein RJ640_020372 [Escallonia rubra]|uniref:Uncharacterized protein n=1 Tax=Escallonia rubra TaxID=112253 RepID=A0AA88QIW9_9ASTE|nr:hypothetical protein RJ640_020372 [Escallonia rubra]
MRGQRLSAGTFGNASSGDIAHSAGSRRARSEIKLILQPPSLDHRIQFQHINIKKDSRLEGLINMTDLTINLVAICTPTNYNMRPLDTIYSNFGAENGLEFTVVRPFNWIGLTLRMHFIPGIDGPRNGVPRVLACFTDGLLPSGPLKLVDGLMGIYSMFGNHNNEVIVRQLVKMMTQVYTKVSAEAALEEEVPTTDVSSKEFYGGGNDNSDKRIPDMTMID